MLTTARPSCSVCSRLFSYTVLCELIIVSEFCSYVVYNHTAAPDGHSKILDPQGQPLSIYHGIYPFLLGLGKYPDIYFFGAYLGNYTFYVNTWVYTPCLKKNDNDVAHYNFNAH